MNISGAEQVAEWSFVRRKTLFSTYTNTGSVNIPEYFKHGLNNKNSVENIWLNFCDVFMWKWLDRFYNERMKSLIHCKWGG